MSELLLQAAPPSDPHNSLQTTLATWRLRFTIDIKFLYFYGDGSTWSVQFHEWGFPFDNYLSDK